MFEFLAQPRFGWEFAAFVAGTIGLFVLLMAVIHPTSNAFKKRLTMVLAFLGGLFYLLEFILPGNITAGRPHRVYLAVQQVKPGTPAVALQPGDIITAWGETPTPDDTALKAAVARTAPGTTVPVQVLRGSALTPATVTVTTPTDPDGPDGPRPEPQRSLQSLGLEVGLLSYSAAVTSVTEGSPAAALQRGDIITGWGGAPTPDYPALNEAIGGAAPGAPVPVTAFRGDAALPVALTVTMPPAPADPDGPEGPRTPPPVTARTLGLDVQNTANPLSQYVTPLGNAQRIFLALALMLGIVNLFRINGRMVLRRRQGWWYAIAFFLGFFAMFGAWALNYYQPGVETAAMPVVEPGSPPTRMPATDAVLTVPPGTPLPVLTVQYNGWYSVMFDGFFTGLSATMFSMLAFFIVSAAYRAFRVRSLEAILLLGSAIIMMLGLTPLGTALITGPIPADSPIAFLKLERIAEWILLVLNGAAQRALLFGIAVGLMATSLRIWLSLERGQFFDAEM